VDLDWSLLDLESHQKLHHYVKELNQLYLNEKPLWELDHKQEGFEWIDPHNSNQSIVTFMRKDKNKDFIIIVSNFTPEYYREYRIGVPCLGIYKEIFNSDLTKYWGSGKGNFTELTAEELNWHNQKYSINIQIPPLATIMLKRKGDTPCEYRNVPN